MQNIFKANLSRLFVVVLIVALALPMAAVFAQGDMEAEIVGDPENPALDVVRMYLMDRDMAALSEDVSLYDNTYGDPIEGYDAVTAYETAYYNDTFSDVLITPARYIVSDNVVVAEYNFTGTNTGPYLGYPATNNVVNMPMAAVFTVEGSEIASMRRYYDAANLQSQLGYTGYYGPDAYPAAASPYAADYDEEILEVDDIVEDDPAAYYGQDLIVEGKIGEMLDANSFYFWDDDLIDLNQERVVVIAGSDQGFGDNFFVIPDTNARVVGRVVEYVIADIEAEVGYDVDDAIFGDYETPAVIIAESATNTEPVKTIPFIEDHPGAFYNQTVTLEGSVGRLLDENTFVFYDDQLIGIAGRILAANATGAFMDFETFDDDQRVRITGTVQPNNALDFESEYGLDVDEDLWDDYSELPVLVASEVMPLE